MKPGTQIAYVPRHAGGDANHQDVEFGFVTSVCENGDCFCRYWSKHSPGEMRTQANSERTPADCLVEWPYTFQASVDELVGRLAT